MPTTKKTISNTKNATPKSAAQTVLGRPIITEKAANMGQYNTYTFSVAVGTTKSEIAKAFFAVYKQKAQHVRTINQSAKSYYR
ncbi:MAG: 50S ribosomal protein L23, partial [Luteimonas sp.]